MGQTSLSVGAAGTQNSDLRTVMCAHVVGWVGSNLELLNEDVNSPTDERSQWATPRELRGETMMFQSESIKAH